MSRRVPPRIPASFVALLLGAASLFVHAVEARAEAPEPAQAEETTLAPAQEPPRVPAQEPTSVHVQVIAATAQEGKAPGSEIDVRLASLQNRLTDFAFSTYRLVDEKRLALVLERHETLHLPGGRTSHIPPR